MSFTPHQTLSLEPITQGSLGLVLSRIIRHLTTKQTRPQSIYKLTPRNISQFLVRALLESHIRFFNTPQYPRIWFHKQTLVSRIYIDLKSVQYQHVQLNIQMACIFCEIRYNVINVTRRDATRRDVTWRDASVCSKPRPMEISAQRPRPGAEVSYGWAEVSF